MVNTEYQQMFNDNFTTIIDDISNIHIWKTISDIPKHITDFIDNVFSDVYYYNYKTNGKYCPKCMTKLDNHLKCSNCFKQYSKFYPNNSIQIGDNDKYEQDVKLYFYIFNVIDSIVFLYLISLNLNNDNSRKIEIKRVYMVDKSGLKELIYDEYTPFKYLDSKIKDNDPFEDMLETYDFSLGDYYMNTRIYTTNLKELQDTIYKYTYIWDTSEFLEKTNVSLIKLVYFPIHFKQFEYLVKLKLFELAYHSPFRFKKGNSFQSTFGIDRKYLGYMQNHNINLHHFGVIKWCNCTNEDVLDFACRYLSFDYKVFPSNAKVKDIKHYFDTYLQNEINMNEYTEYISMATKLGLNIKDRKILFPANLKENFDNLYLHMKVVDNKEIDKTIQSFSDILCLNSFSTNDYVIFPANSVKALIDESRQQHNCVRTYCERYSKGECQIYFMRKKADIEKSFVTIEVQEGKIVQALTKFNKVPDEKVNFILKEWEAQLLLVEG